MANRPPPAKRSRDGSGAAQPPARGNDKPKVPGQPNVPPRTTWLVFLVILLVNYFLVRLFLPGPGEPVTIPYTIFKEQVEKGNVLAIYSKGTSIEGRLAKPVTWPPEDAKKELPPRGNERPDAFQRLMESRPVTSDTFTTELPAFVDAGLEKFLISHKVEISALPIQSGSPWATLIFGFGPALLIILFYVWLYRRAAQQGGLGGGGLMGIG
ncbi:MAG TPA: ATP-dependent metallopeptidase FtsH/Yme1/Tma family protein, partial [Burkholderiales bacterium]|nr:ATP-dependent metallopeptidase FtsH/Yme1/Tma family protein [Burkholderiales bacterium]